VVLSGAPQNRGEWRYRWARSQRIPRLFLSERPHQGVFTM